MKTKHTNGQWYAADNNIGTNHLGITTYAVIAKRKDDYICIADVDGEHISIDELKANAKLIAASKDLLKACSYMIDSFDLDDKSLLTEQQKASIGYTKTAIKKATE